MRERGVHLAADRVHLRRLEPAREVQAAGLGEVLRDLVVGVVGGERAVEVERRAVSVRGTSIDPAVCAGRPSISERSTTHQSRKLPWSPRSTCWPADATRVIGVMRSLTSLRDLVVGEERPGRAVAAVAAPDDHGVALDA